MLVAVERVRAPTNLPLLLAAAGVAAGVGFCLVLLVGDRYLLAVGRLEPRRLSAGVLALLAALSALFAGFAGVGIFGVATALGLAPVRLGCRRVHLMGVLLGPLALGI